MQTFENMAAKLGCHGNGSVDVHVRTTFPE